MILVIANNNYRFRNIIFLSDSKINLENIYINICIILKLTYDGFPAPPLYLHKDLASNPRSSNLFYLCLVSYFFQKHVFPPTGYILDSLIGYLYNIIYTLVMAVLATSLSTYCIFVRDIYFLVHEIEVLRVSLNK